MNIPILPPSNDVEPLRTALRSSDVILDAIFGFSFKPPIRTPFDAALPLLAESGLPIVSVDIPSGWDVEKGNAEGVGLNPDVLISLTAPKEGVRGYTGRHFLGGRFVPRYVQVLTDDRGTKDCFDRMLEEKFELNLPPYPGSDQIVELPRSESSQKL
jgi:NAD(P)H-hydrate epimerase